MIPYNLTKIGGVLIDLNDVSMLALPKIRFKDGSIVEIAPALCWPVVLPPAEVSLADGDQAETKRAKGDLHDSIVLVKGSEGRMTVTLYGIDKEGCLASDFDKVKKWRVSKTAKEIKIADFGDYIRARRSFYIEVAARLDDGYTLKSREGNMPYD